MIKDRKSCNRPHARWPQGGLAKLGKVNARAVVGNRELETASLHKTGNGQRSETREASTCAAERSENGAGFPGVKGDSACRKNQQELGRSDSAFVEDNPQREAITVGGTESRCRMGS